MTTVYLVGLAVLAAIALYVTLIYVAWAIVWHMNRDPQLRAKVWRAMLLETVAVVLIVLLGVPVVHRRFKKLRAGRSEGVPVLCVHGYAANFGNFALLSRKLERAGTGPVYGVNLIGSFRSVENAAAQVARAVRRVLQETGAEKLDLVCHSMGGIVVRAALARHDVGEHVRRVVTLGTPHQGTVLAAYGWGDNARALRIKSDFLRALPPPPVTLTSIWSTADAMVLPVRNAAIGANDVIFDDLGHVSLLLSPRVADAVVKALTAPDCAPDVRQTDSAAVDAAPLTALPRFSTT